MAYDTNSRRGSLAPRLLLSGVLTIVGTSSCYKAPKAEPKPSVTDRRNVSTWFFRHVPMDAFAAQDKAEFKLRITGNHASLRVSFDVGTDTFTALFRGSLDQSGKLVLNPTHGDLDATIRCERQLKRVREAGATMRLHCTLKDQIAWDRSEVLWDAWVCVPDYRGSGYGIYQSFLGKRWLLGATPGIERFEGMCLYVHEGQSFYGFRVIERERG